MFQRKAVTIHSMKALEHISSVLLSNLFSGQNRLDLTVGTASISLKKETSFHLSHEFFSFDVHNKHKVQQTTAVVGGIKFPPLCGTSLPCTPDVNLGVMVS